ncbi:hypothetical protein JMF97_10250 [Micromonospora fiedleri]|uniref:Neocarzinostatin family protein n=1 Tax=Micromonospora fiedleri TaxID=1157498 RepID=A0ABS1UJM0_9ACTN|nr:MULTISPECIES: hypothetical protein [Micromonospora]MBL6276544.1 hypothetical protein [Micromonospora fiedleri]WSK40285.1 hypothetical protein OG712_17255 [Micromonospora maris]
MPARLAAALVSAMLLALGALAAPAYANTIGKGPNGQRLSVSKTSGIPLGGTTVTVTGSGYDIAKGIYVAYCVDNGAGVAPSPCGGGVDTTGSTGASHWISSNPPSYAEGLTLPYGAGGSFTVQVKITSKIGDVDCTTRRCVVASRNDHTRASDRSQDVKVPVSFATAASPSAPAAAPASTVPATVPPAAPANTSAPRTPAAGAAPSAVAGSAAAPKATAAGGEGPTGTAPIADTDQPVLTTQVSDSTGTGRWFTAVLAGLAALLVVVVVLRMRGRRREQR